jgi:hypothetical protein
MPILNIESSGAVFSCRLEDWLESPNEKHVWQLILTRILQYGFVGRSATLITATPMPWSIGHLLGNAKSLRIDQTEFLITYIRECSLELLADVAESEDFQRGLLWLSALDPTEQAQLAALIERVSKTAAHRPEADCEMVMLLDDSRWIHWLYPGRDAKRLGVEVLNMASQFGWPVSGSNEPS